MNNYLDLLGTDFKISIEMVLESAVGHAEVTVNNSVIYVGAVNGTVSIVHVVPLLEPIKIQVCHRGVYLASLKFDGWEARPQHAWEIDGVFTLDTQLPFYQWQHTAAAHGWLLKPY
jgi:hypothetical protein